MKPVVLRWTVTLMVVFNIVAVLYMGYLVFAPVKVIEVHTQDCQPQVQAKDCVLNPGKQVRQGGALIYRIKYCKYTAKQAAVTRTLRGKTVNYPLPASTNNIPVGCKTAISRNTIIPEGVDPGTYRLELTASYQVNPLRTVTVTHESESFDVVPKASGASGTDTSPQMIPVTAYIVSPTPTPTAAPASSPVPFGTDPVTQEPTQPTVTPTPAPAQTVSRPGLVMQVIGSVKTALGIQ